MFYSHTFLARKSPMGMMWIAAHLEHKIKRPQIEKIHIPSFAEKIMIPDVPIALRLSGHLLLGLVRIYSWKVNHLFSDCNRVITDIRKAFASVPVDLPIEADRAPFESVTLPETFDLDALVLDESNCRKDEPDMHLKSYDQITLPDQIPMEAEQYVAICISEDNGMNMSPQPLNVLNTSPNPAIVLDVAQPPNGLNLTPRPPSNGLRLSPCLADLSPVPRQLDEDMLPPFEGSFVAALSPPEHVITADNTPAGNETSHREATDGKTTPLDTPSIESMLEASDHLPQIVASPGTIQFGEQSTPSINPRISLSTIPECISIPEEGSVNRAEQLVITSTNDLQFPDLGASAEQPPPALIHEPAPPVKQEKVKKRKRRQAFDRQLVLSNMQMKMQLDDSSNLVCKRRKLPCSDLDVWKLRRSLRKEHLFVGSLLSRMCTTLVEVFDKSYPCLVANDVNLETPGRNGAEHEGVIPEKEMGPMMMDIQAESPLFDAFSDIERRRDAKNVEDVIPQFTAVNVHDFESEAHIEKTSETALRPAAEISSPPEPIQLNIGTPPFHLREHLLDDTEVPEVPGLLDSSGEDLNFLDANDRSPGNHDEFQVENLSARTRAVAKYFKDNSLAAQSDESGHIRLNSILEQKSRKQCSRMFFETLVLTSHDFIKVEQAEAYGDILISPTPALLSAKF